MFKWHGCFSCMHLPQQAVGLSREDHLKWGGRRAGLPEQEVGCVSPCFDCDLAIKVHSMPSFTNAYVPFYPLSDVTHNASFTATTKTNSKSDVHGYHLNLIRKH